MDQRINMEKAESVESGSLWGDLSGVGQGVVNWECSVCCAAVSRGAVGFGGNVVTFVRRDVGAVHKSLFAFAFAFELLIELLDTVGC